MLAAKKISFADLAMVDERREPVKESANLTHDEHVW